MTALQWNIRAATAVDVPAITTMYQANGLPHAQGDPARAAWQFASVRAMGGKVLVAVEGGAVVGHLELLLCQEAAPLGRYGYVEALEVRQDRRRRGIGRALIDAASKITVSAGGTRLETVADDARAAAFYAATDFQAGMHYLDMDLAVPAEDLSGAAARGPLVQPGARPWIVLRHIAGRQYPASYCWSRAHLASHFGLPEAEGTGAWRLPDSGAVVLADPWLVHLFLPPGIPPDSSDAWPLWQAMFALRADRREGCVRTVVAGELAARLGLPERWPGSTTDEFTLLVRPLVSTCP